MRRILLLAATLFLAAAAPIDLPGWDRSRWGMTTQQLEAAFGSELQALKATLDFVNDVRKPRLRAVVTSERL